MIAYLILAHKNLHQAVRLVRRLATDRALFFVHIDAATDTAGYETELQSVASVEMAPRRHRCPWGEFGIVWATLDLMRCALRHPEVARLTTLTGQDYPLKPPWAIERLLLDEQPGRSFIEHFRMPRPEWGPEGGMSRIEDWHVRFAGRQRSLRNSRLRIRRSLPYGLAPFQGGAYWSMSRSCAELAVGFADEHPRLVRFFRHAHAPDESFFQTIVMNSPLAPTVANDDLRFERWEGDALHPAILTSAELAEMRASPALFAKKFDTDVDAEVLDRIDHDLLHAGR